MTFRLLVVSAVLALPLGAFASVGKVSVLEGGGHRRGADGKAQPLAVGGDIELGDTITLEARSNAKLTLTDASELCLGESSELRIDEAEFQGQERKGFSARLTLGKFWAHVSKALSGNQAKFEVKAARAVAGVRGTIFRIDATPMVSKTYPPPIKKTVVRVTEGKVAVVAEVKRASAAPPPTPGRHQVPGPAQITAEAWEEKFTELQKNQQVTVGDSSFDQTTFDPSEKDAFSRFVERSTAHP